MSIIQAENLTKIYKRYKKEGGVKGSIKGLFHREYEYKTAVNTINMSIEDGEFVGLIGPNGAGKTTLIKLLTGIIAPTNGNLQVMGFLPNKLEREFRRQYAVVMGQKSQLFFDLTVEDMLHLFKEIYNISDQTFVKNREYFVQLLGVEHLLNVQIRTLSLGERMKMELLVALLHDPQVLFLDEPTIGLDAIGSMQIRNYLKEINKEKGTTILLTSHYMDDIRTLCPRSIVINDGQILYDGETSELFENFQLKRVVTAEFSDHIQIDLTSFPMVSMEKDLEYKKIFEVPKEYTSEFTRFLMTHNPKDISITDEEIGKVVQRIYGTGGRQ
jgi:ABC-2 type transport system ATP-binding protein